MGDRTARDLAAALADPALERAVSWVSDRVTPRVALALAVGEAAAVLLLLFLTW